MRGAIATCVRANRVTAQQPVRERPGGAHPGDHILVVFDEAPGVLSATRPDRSEAEPHPADNDISEAYASGDRSAVRTLAAHADFALPSRLTILPRGATT